MAKLVDQLLSVNEAASLLGVGPRQVRKLIASKVLPSELIGRSHVIRRGDVAKVPQDRKPGRPRKADQAA